MSDPFATHLIRVAVDALRRFIVPTVQDETTRTYVDLVTRVLNHAAFRISDLDPAVARLIEKDGDILAAAQKLLGQGAGAHTQSVGQALADQFDKQRRKVEADVCAQVPGLVRLSKDKGPKGVEAVTALKSIVEAQRQFFMSQDPEIAKGSAVVYRGGRIDDENLPELKSWNGAELNEQTLTDYLRKQSGDSKVTARNMRTVLGGFSKTTILFNRFNGTEPGEDLAIRKDMIVPLSDLSVVDEYPLLRALHKVGFTVAEPLWLEKDANLFGGAFIVSRRAAGTSDFKRWAGDPGQVKSNARELAQTMAKLHSLTLEELGYDRTIAAKSAGATMRDEIEKWHRQLGKDGVRPNPLLEMLFAWLSDNIPAYAFDRPARVVHGDVGFHNLMFNDGKVTALLDWEYSHIGDPMADLYYAKLFVSQIMEWQEFVGYYLEAGGVPVPPEAESFYNLWPGTRNGVGATGAQKLFLGPYATQIKYAVSGYVFAPYVHLEASSMLVNEIERQRGK